MLSKRWIVNIALLALISGMIYAGLGFDEEAAIKMPAGISELAAGDIDRLEIESDGSLIRLQRDGDAWMIEAPLNWPAHGVAIKRLLDIVDIEADALGTAADVDLAALGLLEPVAALRFNDSRLLFGTNNNIGARRYAMIESRVYLLPDAHLPFISQGLAGVIDRRLLPTQFVPRTLQLPNLDIRRADDDAWYSTQAPHLAAAQLEQLVANWQQLEATRVTRLDAASEARQVVEIQLSDGARIEFLVVSTDAEIVIANLQAGLQYHFRSSDYVRLLAPGNDENPG